MIDNKNNGLQFESYRKNYLMLQRKYEAKIIELSIIQEMNNTMQQVDLIDQDLVWLRHLECLKKYKGLVGAVLYFSKDNEIKQDYFFYSEFDEAFDCKLLKETDFFRKIVIERKESFCDPSTDTLFKKMQVFCYGRPIIIKERLIGALMLFSMEKDIFETANLFFYKIVCDHLCNSMVFLRLYYGKLDEEKQMIQLSRFFSKSVVGEIFKKGKLRLGGEKKEVAVMFVDLKGFTALSEGMQPEDVVTLLNRFFSRMIPIIFKYKGTLDKLLGDGIMAVFGTPIEDNKSCLNAVKTALEMFSSLSDLNTALEKEGRFLEMTVGINYGELVSGFMGSEEHLNYTVIGDTVNAAQRIQSMAGSSQILLSEAVYKQIAGHLSELNNFSGIRKLDAVKLKGKEKKVHLYQMDPMPTVLPSRHLEE